VRRVLLGPGEGEGEVANSAPVRHS
jgi:hypothetical protein